MAVARARDGRPVAREGENAAGFRCGQRAARTPFRDSKYGSRGNNGLQTCRGSRGSSLRAGPVCACVPVKSRGHPHTRARWGGSARMPTAPSSRDEVSREPGRSCPRICVSSRSIVLGIYVLRRARTERERLRKYGSTGEFTRPGSGLYLANFRDTRVLDSDFDVNGKTPRNRRFDLCSRELGV